MEPKKRIELSSSAWKAEVLTIIQLRHMAGVEGLEPTSLVLETKAQPLYQTPIGWEWKGSNLHMSGSKPDDLPICLHPNMADHKRIELFPMHRQCIILTVIRMVHMAGLK